MAVAVAIVMALQILLGTFAMAANAATPMVDAFGNMLCINSAEGDDSGSTPNKDRPLLPECCTLACGLVHSFVPADTSVAVLFNPLSEPLQRPVIRFAEPFHSVLDSLPGNPRAPPFA
ncbi:hypothetical protein P9A16_33070 [Shinella sp. 838]|uniref:DUF2946 family protein n=1 Tax=unclassified Shinella TaxID=2643062 RepID=UPI002414FA22|nr:DUF2946 family protein [Shinella sp. 838]MDG4675936.1 hypothetical protein [Shinella sp. 838]